MTSKTAKIQKTIARQQEKIASGDYYEAHQQLRTIAARYTKSNDFASAIDVLHSGALALLTAGQGSSGSDLGVQLIEVLGKTERKVDAETRALLLGLLRAFPEGEVTRKKYVAEMIGWSVRAAGGVGCGDPEMHHVVGGVYAKEAEAYDAERHLALGTLDSATTLAQLEYTWYTQDTPDTAALYAARAVLPYLLLSNLRAANKAYLLFTSHLSSGTHNGALSVQEVSSTAADVRVYPSLPLVNFLGLLLLAVQRGSGDLFKLLAKHYAPLIKEVGGWDDALARVGEMYFGIRIPRQGNPLMEMMGGLMGFGGGGGGGGAGGKSKAKTSAPPPPPPPPAEGLD